jgi:hypothetical protein
MTGGIYTDLAKRRAEQSKEPVSHGSPIPPLEKQVVHAPQLKKATPPSQQTHKRAKLSLTPTLPDPEMVEKYTTHVEPSLMKKIRIEAAEKEINDYDVVRIALKEYFEKNK